MSDDFRRFLSELATDKSEKLMGRIGDLDLHFDIHTFWSKMHTNGLQIRIFPIEANGPRNVIRFMSGHAYREVTGLIKMINFDYFLLESQFDLAAKQPHCQHSGWSLGKWIYNKFPIFHFMLKTNYFKCIEEISISF